MIMKIRPALPRIPTPNQPSYTVPRLYNFKLACDWAYMCDRHPDIVKDVTLY